MQAPKAGSDVTKQKVVAQERPGPEQYPPPPGTDPAGCRDRRPARPREPGTQRQRTIGLTRLTKSDHAAPRASRRRPGRVQGTDIQKGRHLE